MKKVMTKKAQEQTPAIQIGSDDRLFVLTGAGVSAESGLATFRGAGGLWHGHHVEDVASPEAWERDPELVWTFYSMRRKKASTVRPNPAHRALARLERELGERFFLCTQNVDRLHERAGSKRLVHMHGELFQSRCESCGSEPFADENVYESLAAIPRCCCGARIRPNIVWFGEAILHLPRIVQELERCTVLLAVGTSGLVQPAASFVHWAGSRERAGGAGIRTYYVGPEKPANSSAFTDIFSGNAGELLPGLFKVQDFKVEDSGTVGKVREEPKRSS
jgi:NAD-dependent protein deacetylase/lipoamidase